MNLFAQDVSKDAAFPDRPYLFPPPPGSLFSFKSKEKLHIGYFNYIP